MMVKKELGSQSLTSYIFFTLNFTYTHFFLVKFSCAEVREKVFMLCVMWRESGSKSSGSGSVFCSLLPPSVVRCIFFSPVCHSKKWSAPLATLMCPMALSLFPGLPAVPTTTLQLKTMFLNNACSGCDAPLSLMNNEQLFKNLGRFISFPEYSPFFSCQPCVSINGLWRNKNNFQWKFSSETCSTWDNLWKMLTK